MEEGHNELSVLYSVYGWLLQNLFTLSMHATLFPFHPHSSLIIIYAVYLHLSLSFPSLFYPNSAHRFRLI